MQITIPEAKQLAAKAEGLLKSVDGRFMAIQAPSSAQPNMTAGQILEVMSRPRVDYKKEIQQIWDKSLSEFAEIEKGFQRADDYASFVNRCLFHISEGYDIGEELDAEVGFAARIIRRSHVAGVITRQEITDMVCKCRDDLRESLKELQRLSGHTKRQRRALKKALMANTNKTIGALLTQRDTTLSQLERKSLKHYRDRLTKNEGRFTETYRKMYFAKSGGYKEDIPTYGFRALRGLT